VSSVNYARHFFYVRLLLILFFAANVVGKNDSRVYQLLSALIINHAKVEIPILLMIQRTVYHA
jgi:hypothetical protein